MKIDLQEWTFPTTRDRKRHFSVPGMGRTLCGYPLDAKRRPTGEGPVCWKCWTSRERLSERGGL